MDTGRNKIGTCNENQDAIDKSIVEHFYYEYCVNPEKYGKKYPLYNNDIQQKSDCGCNYCKNFEEYEDNNMNEDEQETCNTEEVTDHNDWSNPNCHYQRLGVDILSVRIGQDLLPIFETYWDNMMSPKVMDLRKKLTDNYGYIIPRIRFLDVTDIEPNSYQIYVREHLVFTGYFDMNTDNSVESIVKYSNCADKLLEDVEKICFEYVHQVVTKTDILKLMELARSQDPTLVNDLIPIFISAIDLKKIYANLIYDKVSAKDIIYVFELLNDYARYTQDINELTEKLKHGLNFVH